MLDVIRYVATINACEGLHTDSSYSAFCGEARGGFSACCQRLKCWHQCLLVAAQWQQALGLLAGMRKAALVLDVITDDAAISACVKLHADSSHLAFRQSCSRQIGCSLSSIETLPSGLVMGCTISAIFQSKWWLAAWTAQPRRL